MIRTQNTKHFWQPYDGQRYTWSIIKLLSPLIKTQYMKSCNVNICIQCLFATFETTLPILIQNGSPTPEAK